jgi:hypothetical protein
VTMGSRETNLEKKPESQYIIEQIWIGKNRLWDITMAYSVSALYILMNFHAHPYATRSNGVDELAILQVVAI